VPHGRPDWYNITPMIQVHASEDVNELAARLGSLDVFDRRGNVVYYNDFSHGAPDFDGPHGVGNADAYIATAGSLTNGVSLCLTCDGEDDNYVYVRFYVAVPVAPVFGFETGWTITGTWDNFYVRISLEDGTQLHRVGLLTYKSDMDLYYYDSDGNWTKVADTYGWRENAYAQQYWKLVASMDDDLHRRALWNGSAVSMTDKAVYTEAASYPGYVELFIYLEANTGTAPKLYLDYVILTINED